MVAIVRPWGSASSNILLDKLWIDRVPVKNRSFMQLLYFSNRGWGVIEFE